MGSTPIALPVAIGVAAVVYGGADDSPGLQLLGVLPVLDDARRSGRTDPRSPGTVPVSAGGPAPQRGSIGVKVPARASMTVAASGR